MLKPFLLLAGSIACVFALSQPRSDVQPAGGGPIPFSPADHISEEQRNEIIRMLRRNTAELQLRGLLPTMQPRLTTTALGWPLRMAAGISADNGYYGISNYVDHNLATPNQLKDYSCGVRTYDLASGYNHKGTDIFTWPFPWAKMNQNAVEVIAGAGGTIIGRIDGNPDQNCAFCTSSCNWNAVYIQHADGSVAWYGHLKAGSVTAKTLGQTVSAGEYLGVVGSSGNSTGPHLHLELYTNNTYTQLVDPWAGTCNSMNGTTSWWAAQEEYRVPTIIKTLTHSVAPTSSQCPGGEAMNVQLNFSPGQRIYFSSYYRDNMAGQTAVHRIYTPDNFIWSIWNQTFNTTYNASYWNYFWDFPTTGLQNGVWRYEVTFNGQSVSTNFGINTQLPLTLLSFGATKQKGAVLLKWETENEVDVAGFEVQRALEGEAFETIVQQPAKNLVARNLYNAMDPSPLKGYNLYRLKMVDRSGAVRYSSIVKVDNKDGKLLVQTGPSPFRDWLVVRIKGQGEKLRIQLHSISGQLMEKRQGVISGTTRLATDRLPAGLYFLSVWEGDLLIERTKVLKQ